jgi:hypothetical protein
MEQYHSIGLLQAAYQLPNGRRADVELLSGTYIAHVSSCRFERTEGIQMIGRSHKAHWDIKRKDEIIVSAR